MTYRPKNGGAVLPIARLGRLGWFVEGADARGNTWTMQPRGAVTIEDERRIAQLCAAALRHPERVLIGASAPAHEIIRGGKIMTRVTGPARLNARPVVFAHVKGVMAVLQSEGIVPRDRAPIDGTEFVLTIDAADASLAPKAFAIFYECEAERLWVDLIHTQPVWRRHGLGIALLRALDAFAAETGMRKVMFGTATDNEPMRKLGQALGYLTQHVVMAKPILQPVNQLVPVAR